MWLNDNVRAALEGAGYRVRAISENDLVFEDESLLGFVSVKDTVSAILDVWASEQDAFLKGNATQLRKEPRKAWNVYSVFLTEADCEAAQMSRVLDAEEDFRGTRKIVRCGLKTESDIQRALYPLLPIENVVALSSEDAMARVRGRLDLSEAIVAALAGNVELDRVADELVRQS